jgi:hypothetical protein
MCRTDAGILPGINVTGVSVLSEDWGRLGQPDWAGVLENLGAATPIDASNPSA